MHWSALASVLLLSACHTPAGGSSADPSPSPIAPREPAPQERDRAAKDATIHACERAVRVSARDNAYAFFVTDEGAVDVRPEACRFVVRMTHDCWPGRCTVSLTAVGEPDVWSGPYTATKAGDFHFTVRSSAGVEARFGFYLPRHDANLTVGEHMVRGRLVPVWEPWSCRTPQHVEQLDGRLVRVDGVYTPIVVAKGPERTTDDEGRSPRTVAIRTAEGLSLMLGIYWRADAARDEAEVQQLAGRRVVVVGTVHRRTPTRNDGSGEYQTMIGPYLDVDAIDVP